MAFVTNLHEPLNISEGSFHSIDEIGILSKTTNHKKDMQIKIYVTINGDEICMACIWIFD